MFLIDTNVFCHLYKGDDRAITSLENVRGEVFLTTLAIEEILVHGIYAEIQKIQTKKSRSTLDQAYLEMARMISWFAHFSILPYTDAAEHQYRQIKALLGGRVKKYDGRIAAHALVSGMVLVTRNVQDFQDIPGLIVQNWVDDIDPVPAFF